MILKIKKMINYIKHQVKDYLSKNGKNGKSTRIDWMYEVLLNVPLQYVLFPI